MLAEDHLGTTSARVSPVGNGSGNYTVCFIEEKLSCFAPNISFNGL